ncbi:MAG: hypothetical protein WKF91_00095 [Segetibacter sp.]
MNNIEFILFTIEHWPALLCWSIFFMVLLFIPFINLVPAKVYDPFHIFVAFNFGIGYGVVASLYQYGYINNRLFFIIMGYGLLFNTVIYLLLKRPLKLAPIFYKHVFMPFGNGRIEFILLVSIYTIFSLLMLTQTGFGALVDTNRFEAAKGFGMFVRILDLFRLVILAYWVINIFRSYRLGKSKKRFYTQFCLLILFLIFSSLQSGAKFAFIEGVYVMLVALYAMKIDLKINFIKAFFILLTSTVFALFVLNLNLKNSESDSTGVFSDEGNIVSQRFLYRIIGNGESYYLSLPNEVIDQIQTDNLFVRFASQIIGISLLSKMMGYNVGDYSVGRALLLYYDPENDIAGGPTSRFDLFAYKYFGIFAFVFIILIAFILSGIANALKKAPQNVFYISVLSALWFRALYTLIEPPAGIAYIFDTIILIFSINSLHFLYKFVRYKRTYSPVLN